MKNYTLKKTQGVPDWEQISAAQIGENPWFTVNGIEAAAKAAWNETGIYVRLQAKEPNVLARYSQPWDAIYTDSCLEFFFAPTAGDPRYFNFEINPNGGVLTGFGKDRNSRVRLIYDNWQEKFQVQSLLTEDGWEVSLFIPLTFLHIFMPELKLETGALMGGNFYKCGDETKEPHYMCWNPIGTENPDFHRPEYFGRLILGE